MNYEQATYELNGERCYVLYGEHLTITYHDILLPIAHFILEHYDRPENDDVLVCVNVLHSDDMWEHAGLNGFARRIFYNLEQYVVKSSQLYFVNTMFPYIRNHNFGEIWDFLIENWEFTPDDLKPKFRFVTPRYAEFFNSIRNKIAKIKEARPPRYDLFFSGLHNTEIRLQVLAALETNRYTTDGIRYLTGCGYTNLENYDMQAMARFVLDFPHYSLMEQTQTTTRIYDMIMCGNCVVGHTNPKFLNYYEGIIIGVPADTSYDFAAKVKEVVKTVEPDYTGWMKFKELTNTDESYRDYRFRLLTKWMEISGQNIPANVVLAHPFSTWR